MREISGRPAWLLWALGSAFFAALTAVFGKIGVGEINSNLATLIRTVVILVIAAAIVTVSHQWERLDLLSHRGALFLVLSGVATGLSWLCYYRALQLGPVTRVAPIDKLSVALAVTIGIVALGEPATWKVAAGTALIVAGSIVLAW